MPERALSQVQVRREEGSLHGAGGAKAEIVAPSGIGAGTGPSIGRLRGHEDWLLRSVRKGQGRNSRDPVGAGRVLGKNLILNLENFDAPDSKDRGEMLASTS